MVSKNKELRKHKSQSLFFSIFLGVLALGLISFLFISDFRISQKRAEYLSQIKTLEADILKQEERNNQLKSGILNAGTDVYWEQKLREQGYKKPGEEQVVVLPPKDNGIQQSAVAENWWQKLLKKIGL